MYVYWFPVVFLVAAVAQTFEVQSEGGSPGREVLLPSCTTVRLVFVSLTSPNFDTTVGGSSLRCRAAPTVILPICIWTDSSAPVASLQQRCHAIFRQVYKPLPRQCLSNCDRHNSQAFC